MFKTIENTNNLYQVNELGEIYSHITKRVLKNRLNDAGYTVCDLEINSHSKPCRVHRLIALSFIPLVHGKNCINHKNGVRYDNRLENLEWCTQAENLEHSRKVLGNLHLGPKRRGKDNVNSKPVAAIHKITKQEFYFESCRLAGEALGVSFQNIYHQIKGHTKTAGGYTFKFI